jgi:hypothetical protein
MYPWELDRAMAYRNRVRPEAEEQARKRREQIYAAEYEHQLAEHTRRTELRRRQRAEAAARRREAEEDNPLRRSTRGFTQGFEPSSASSASTEERRAQDDHDDDDDDDEFVFQQPGSGPRLWYSSSEGEGSDDDGQTKEDEEDETRRESRSDVVVQEADDDRMRRRGDTPASSGGATSRTKSPDAAASRVQQSNAWYTAGDEWFETYEGVLWQVTNMVRHDKSRAFNLYQCVDPRCPPNFKARSAKEAKRKSIPYATSDAVY